MPRGRKKQEPINDDIVEEKTKKKRGKKAKPKTEEPDIEVVADNVAESPNDINNLEENENLDDNSSLEILDENEEVTDDNSSDWNNNNIPSKTRSSIERGSAHPETPRSMTTGRVKIVEAHTTATGKTYNRDDFKRRRNNHKKNTNSVLYFSYREAINIGESKTLSEASVDEILKYLIATNKDKFALCSVFKNTLSGIHNETTLPQTTYVSNKSRRFTNRRRN